MAAAELMQILQKVIFGEPVVIALRTMITRLVLMSGDYTYIQFVEEEMLHPNVTVISMNLTKSSWQKGCLHA
jgi:hypothetical protein